MKYSLYIVQLVLVDGMFFVLMFLQNVRLSQANRFAATINVVYVNKYNV